MKRRPRQEISLKECYDILRLKKSATLDEVKHSYRLRAFELHPDLNPGNPNAGNEFQTLNEAYVLLSGILEKEEAAKNVHKAAKDKTQAQTERNQKEEKSARENEEKAAREKAREEEAKAAKDKKEREEQEARAAERQSSANQEETETGQNRDPNRKRAAESAYGQGDVLRDLLDDPFARRVFEDIYSEINRQGAENSKNSQPEEAKPAAPQPEPKSKFLKFEWGDNKNNGVNFKNGVSGAVKGWLRNQIDDEQTFKFPAAKLFPGARIRLRIRQAFSDDLTTIEIVLPKDFTLGKPVRLRGLGKKVGPWQGDLYLRLEAQ